MIQTIKLFFTKTIKRQLIFGVVITFFILMNIFMYNLINSQKEFLHNQILSQTINLTNSFSKNSTSWVLSNDYIGMEEIVESVINYQDLKYAMLLSLDGKVLANSDKKYTNQYINDKVSLQILSSKPKEIVLIDNNKIIDVAVPILRDTQHIGWARIALGKENIVNNINKINKYAIIYIFISSIIASIFSYILAQWLTKDLDTLIEVAKQTTIGAKDSRANFIRDDEIGILASKINEMLDKNDLDEKKLIEELEKNRNKDKLLAQQSKMAAMGEMIGNIAHQWRQPLNALGLTIQKIKIFHDEGILTDEKLDKSVQKSKMLIDKMSTTIDDFRNFFRTDRAKEKFFIKDAIDEILTLLEASLKNHNIEIDTADTDDKIELLGHKNELEQVLLNIINNAKDALIENKIQNAKIEIRTFGNQESMTIKISDNAGGIPKDIIDKIFDPYFTTKKQGKGTGIGLYMSKTIIETNMNGKLSMQNYEDGACFTIKIKVE